jgi:hypothetical protein
MLRLAQEDDVWDQLQTTIRAPMPVAESAARHIEFYRDRSFAVA